MINDTREKKKDRYFYFVQLQFRHINLRNKLYSGAANVKKNCRSWTTEQVEQFLHDKACNGLGDQLLIRERRTFFSTVMLLKCWDTGTQEM